MVQIPWLEKDVDADAAPARMQGPSPNSPNPTRHCVLMMGRRAW
jgi:hypothetical protein